MKKRKLVLLVLVFVLMLSLLSCGNKEDNKEYKYFFWEVTSQEGTKLYLMGSIHIGDDSIYPFDDHILNAFNESDILAVEADIDSLTDDVDRMIEILSYYAYVDNSVIDNHISKDLLDRAKAYLEENEEYDPLYHYFKPAFWMDVISTIGIGKTNLDTEKGVDLFFIKEAKKKDKMIYELESLEFQAKMMADLRDEIQEYLLLDAIDNAKDTSQGLEEIFDVWKSGNLKKLVEIFEDEPDDELYKEYNKITMLDRNKEMVKKAVEFLKGDKSVFFVVGTAHMIGEKGLVKELEREGYTVTRK